MSIERNVEIVRSPGGICFVCEREIQSGETVIRVSFNVNLVITTKRVSEDMHTRCGQDLRDLLDLRIAEARRREAGR